MRILLVSFALLANHGGILQCYALQEVLKGMGHKVVKAEVKPNFRFTIHQVLAIVKRFLVRTFITKNSIPVFYERQLDRPRNTICQNTDKFIKRYLRMVRVNSLSELKGFHYDAVIVGSDQVWRRPYAKYDKLLTFNSAADNAFLAFTHGWNCKRIAYSASIGVDYWEYTEEETQVLKELIRKFDAISVREDSGINLIHEHLGADLQVEHLLDPTLLLDKYEYIKLFKKTKTKRSEGDLLVYVLDPSDEKKRIVDYYVKKLNKKPFLVNNPNYENRNLSPEERIQTPIETWLRGFYDADYVVADSFHACVFSIIFEKPFTVIVNEQRGVARIDSLLHQFGLEDRVVRSMEDVEKVPLAIDWTIVREKKKKFASKSRQWLVEALECKRKKWIH